MAQAHTANIFKSMKDMKFEGSISHECGVTMNDSVESRAIAEVMGEKEGITVTYLPAMIRIDGEPKITFKMSEISEVRWPPKTGQAAKRESSLGTAVWPEVRLVEYPEEAQS